MRSSKILEIQAALKADSSTDSQKQKQLLKDEINEIKQLMTGKLHAFKRQFQHDQHSSEMIEKIQSQTNRELEQIKVNFKIDTIKHTLSQGDSFQEDHHQSKRQSIKQELIDIKKLREANKDSSICSEKDKVKEKEEDQIEQKEQSKEDTVDEPKKRQSVFQQMKEREKEKQQQKEKQMEIEKQREAQRLERQKKTEERQRERQRQRELQKEQQMAIKKQTMDLDDMLFFDKEDQMDTNASMQASQVFNKLRTLSVIGQDANQGLDMSIMDIYKELGEIKNMVQSNAFLPQSQNVSPQVQRFPE